MGIEDVKTQAILLQRQLIFYQNQIIGITQALEQLNAVLDEHYRKNPPQILTNSPTIQEVEKIREKEAEKKA